jgi:hypothetical protein
MSGLQQSLDMSNVAAKVDRNSSEGMGENKPKYAYSVLHLHRIVFMLPQLPVVSSACGLAFRGSDASAG